MILSHSEIIGILNELIAFYILYIIKLYKKNQKNIIHKNEL